MLSLQMQHSSLPPNIFLLLDDASLLSCRCLLQHPFQYIMLFDPFIVHLTKKIIQSQKIFRKVIPDFFSGASSLSRTLSSRVVCATCTPLCHFSWPQNLLLRLYHIVLHKPHSHCGAALNTHLHHWVFVYEVTAQNAGSNMGYVISHIRSSLMCRPDWMSPVFILISSSDILC